MSGPKIKRKSDVISMKVSALTLYTITSAHISWTEASDEAKYDVNEAGN